MLLLLFITSVIMTMVLKKDYFETDGKLETLSFKSQLSVWKPAEVVSSVSHSITHII